MTSGIAPDPGAARARIRVLAWSTPQDRKEWEFRGAFRIGRTEECEVCVKNDYVSRAHASVVFENGQWWVRDLGSANGVFVGGERIQSVAVTGQVAIRLGIEGPFVLLTNEPLPAPPPALLPPAPVLSPPAAAAPATAQAPTPAKAAGPDPDLARYIEHYFGKTAAGQPAGEHTIMVRRAFEQVQTKQRSKYVWVLAVLGVCLLGAGGYAWFLHQQVEKQRAGAQDLFYAMKSLDVDIAGVEKLLADSGSPQASGEIRRYRDRRQELKQSYDRYLASLKVYTAKMSEQDRLIYRVTRIFGECELTMPPGFVAEVGSYIKRWQSTDRYAKAIRAANEQGYPSRIAQELLAQDLPPQFFYLAMQESSFDVNISGPPTRKGIAKGMWQFIPETAAEYGLRVGPLADLRRPDPGDERQRFAPATKAAARYLKDLYSTDAQASGFLVMACYNWGEDQVLPLVRSLPANPRDRNFWRLLAKSRERIPQETYDYVFYIVSAAVIGENPRLFGFDFDNPLAHLESR